MRLAKLSSFSIATAILVSGLGISQAATTDPVGAVAHQIPTGGSIFSHVFQNEILFQGQVGAINGTQLDVTIGSPLDSEIVSVPHYVQVISGSATGSISNVISANSTSVVVESSVSGLAVGDSVVIRRHMLLSDMKGDPEFSDSTTLTIYNSDGTKDVFEYISGASLGLPYGLWAELPGYTDASNSIIYPGEGVVIYNPSTPRDITLYGAVSVNPIKVNFGTEFSLVGPVNPVGTATLGASFADLPVGSTLTFYAPSNGNLQFVESYEAFDRADLGLGTGLIWADSTNYLESDSLTIGVIDAAVVNPAGISGELLLPAAYNP